MINYYMSSFNDRLQESLQPVAGRCFYRPGLSFHTCASGVGGLALGYWRRLLIRAKLTGLIPPDVLW